MKLEHGGTIILASRPIPRRYRISLVFQNRFRYRPFSTIFASGTDTNSAFICRGAYRGSRTGRRARRRKWDQARNELTHSLARSLTHSLPSSWERGSCHFNPYCDVFIFSARGVESAACACFAHLLSRHVNSRACFAHLRSHRSNHRLSPTS